MRKFAAVLIAVSAIAAAFATFPKEHVIGTWLLNGTDVNTKWVFYKDQKFLFKGTMSTSRGTWSTDGNKISLTWTEIDGKPVKANTVKGSYPLLEDGSWQVDQYNYKKKK
ncbi:MAG TPA: hypothetical protein VNI20_00090 [Fimbriimonadaceae bacterium]|nr:hypothetical protein [Fimbriimonadaceae bacterium]